MNEVDGNDRLREMQNQRVPTLTSVTELADVLTTGSNQRTPPVGIRLTETSVNNPDHCSGIDGSCVNEVEPVTTACGDAESACTQP